MPPPSDHSGPGAPSRPTPSVPPDYRPTPQRRGGAAHGRLFALLIVGLVVVGVVLTWSAARTGSKDPERLELGDRVFAVGRSESLAEAVEENGPLLFQDPLGKGRHVYVQYLGTEGETPRWVAFQAVRTGSPERCVLQWSQDTKTLRDPCDDTTYPADGAGLVHYATVVENGRLSVDLNTVVPAEP